MSGSTPRKNRRKALQDIAGAGALAGLAPLLGRLFDEQSAMSLIPSAYAQGMSTGVRPGEGRVLHVSGEKAAAVNMAEWDPPAGANAGAETGGLRIAQGDGPIKRAPDTAGRYTAKAFDFPSGELRVLTWKKGGPVMHQVTYETMIMVLEGSVTLAPAKGINAPTATLKAGDAVHLPSGVLRNMKPATDTVLLQAYVGSASDHPKSTIVYAKNIKQGSAKKGQGPYTYKIAKFDGNSMRAFKFAKGGKVNEPEGTPTDVLIYITKGRVRRTEGGQTFEAVAGDAVCLTQKVPGSWDVLEDTELVALDAPTRLATAPGLIGTPGGVKLFAMNIDDNGRSRMAAAEVAMKPVSGTESLSEKHPGLIWRLGPRPQINAYARTSKSYTSANGPYEQHTGGTPHFTGCMAGHIETTMQDGGVLRRCAGEFSFITPGALHHSNFRSDVPSVYFNLYVPGTDTDTKTPTF